MSRFFIPPESIKGNNIIINGREAHHILDVMRLEISDRIVAFDGTGKEYVGLIKNISRNSLTVEITETRTPTRKEVFEITLLQAIPKKEKMDYIIEKSTELGVHSIVPVITQRTIPNWNEPKRLSQVKRWEKIAKEAAKQCGRRDIPAISAISKFADAVKNFADFNMRLIAILSDDALPIKDAMAGFKSGRIAIAIGPEGDFTLEEARAAKACGFKAISLGSRILKSDTAGLALLSILNYELSS